MNIKKIVAAFTAAAALVVSAPFAALPNATASAVSSDFTDSGIPSAQADISVIEEPDRLKTDTVTATAKIGDTELASDKIIVNEKGRSVTIVVPNDAEPEQISATIAFTAIKGSDKSEVQVSTTDNMLWWGEHDFRVTMPDDDTSGWDFFVYVVTEQGYKEHTVHTSVEMIGYDDNEPAHELQYIYTTEKKARSETFNDCDTSLMLHDGDKVMTGTPVYVVNAHRNSGRFGIKICDDKDNEIPLNNIVVTDWKGENRSYTYFFVPEGGLFFAPEGGVNICETHTRTYSARYTINNREYGTVKRIYDDGHESDISENIFYYGAEDETFEYSLTPNKGYSAVMTVKDYDGNIIPVTKGENNKYSFTMPAKDVKITIDFVEISQPEPDDSSDTSTSSSDSSDTSSSSPDSSDTSTSTPDSSDTSTSTPNSSDTSTSTPDSSDTSTDSTSAVGTIDDTPASSDTSTSTPAVTEKEFKPTITDTNLNDEQKRVLGGITVTDTNGAFDDDVVMNIAPGQSENRLFSFNITFTKDGKEVQPKNSVTVKVPVPEALKDKKIYVFHNENGRKVLVNSEVKDGFVIFSADHFSEYILSADNLAETGSTETTASTNTPSNNPDTGVAVAAVPVVIAISTAVIIIAKKKK